MNKKRLFALTLVGALAVSSLAGCKKKEETTPAPAGGETKVEDKKPEEKKIAGEIVVLTNRTDIVDSVFKAKYLPEFNKKYPDVKVEFEAITDYENTIKTRLNTKDYGDVLLLPYVPKEELKNFFEPLGQYDEMSQKYEYLLDKSFDGISYGIPQVANTQGILINKKVWDNAGASTNLKSSAEFIDALKKIKAKGEATEGALYTNFNAKWPLNQWDSNGLAISGDPNWKNKMTKMDEPFVAGEGYYEVWKLMYDVVKEGVIEADPVTTDWEKSKQLLADGKIGAMVLGSWAIGQVKALAANPDDIVYMPFPAAPGGKKFAAAGGDYNLGINVNSKNKEAARAWLDWFVHESNYYVENHGISPVKGTALPPVLQAYADAGVQFVIEAAAPAGEEGLWDSIEKESAIGINSEVIKQDIVTAALNKTKSFEDIAKELNQKWKTAKAKVVK